jgi:hypothetical protein
MKKFTLMTLIFLLSTPSFAEFCNWGFVGPKKIKCDGEVYISGTVICGSELYRDVFCHSSKSHSGKDCAEDNSQQTVT